MWTIKFYNDAVIQEITSLPKKLKAKVFYNLKLLSEYGNEIGEPRSKHVKNGLFELRTKSDDGIARCFYCFMIKKEIIILHSFIKKSQKIPQKELDTALKRLKELKDENT